MKYMFVRDVREGDVLCNLLGEELAEVTGAFAARQRGYVVFTVKGIKPGFATSGQYPAGHRDDQVLVKA